MRAIRKVGGSYFIKISPSDIKDLGAEVGDEVCIDDVFKPQGEVQ